MNIIIGHTNTDLDCLGSMILVRHLFPGYVLVKSRLMHPAAKNLFMIYKNHFDILPVSELKNHEIENIVIVDTSVKKRVDEFFKLIGSYSGSIKIFDHHPPGTGIIEDAAIHRSDYGANTTFIGLEIIKRKIKITADEATIALTGIYADTGNFTHENVKDSDFLVASHLIENGASIPLVRKFLTSLKEEHQILLFHDLLNQLTTSDIHGHKILLSLIDIEKQAMGIAAVVEKIFDVENHDAYFAVFYFRKENDVLIIARSRKNSIELNRILEDFGGGGHSKAASALLKDTDGKTVYGTLLKYLDNVLVPAITADMVMTEEVDVLNENITMLEASRFFEQTNHTGAPVINNKEETTGIMTLRNIMKARKAEQMHCPGKGYMSVKIATAERNYTMRQIEKLLLMDNHGHLPVLDDKRIIGLITRTDYLDFLKKKRKERKRVIKALR